MLSLCFSSNCPRTNWCQTSRHNHCIMKIATRQHPSTSRGHAQSLPHSNNHRAPTQPDETTRKLLDGQVARRCAKRGPLSEWPFLTKQKNKTKFENCGVSRPDQLLDNVLFSGIVTSLMYFLSRIFCISAPKIDWGLPSVQVDASKDALGLLPVSVAGCVLLRCFLSYFKNMFWIFHFSKVQTFFFTHRKIRITYRFFWSVIE